MAHFAAVIARSIINTLIIIIGFKAETENAGS